MWWDDDCIKPPNKEVDAFNSFLSGVEKRLVAVGGWCESLYSTLTANMAASFSKRISIFSVMK